MAKYAYFTGDDSERFHFVMIPYIFFEDEKLKKLSSDAKILYGLMLGKMNLSRKNGWLDEKGRVYIRWSNEELCKDLGRSEPTVVKIKKELEKEGLIEKDRKGLGKCDLIYVKDILHMVDENVEDILLANEPGTSINTQNLKNLSSGTKGEDKKELKNFKVNYINNNYINNNYRTRKTYPKSAAQGAKYDFAALQKFINEN